MNHALGGLAVVIVNYRSAQWIRSCVRSLSSDAPVARIIVVNNSASDSEDASILSSVREDDARVTLHDLPENAGFGAAVNVGVRIAKESGLATVWILNPDVVVEAGAVEVLQASLAPGTPTIVSPLIWTTMEGRHCVSYAGGSIDVTTGRVEHARYREPLAAAPAGRLPVSFVTGAAMMMNISTFELIGGFREDLFLYWEDVDLSLRACRAGVRMELLPEARVWHAEGGSAESRSDKFYYFNQRNRLIVCHEVLGLSLARLLLGRGCAETVRLLLRPLRREKQHRLRKTARSVRGIAAGVREVRRAGRVSQLE